MSFGKFSSHLLFGEAAGIQIDLSFERVRFRGAIMKRSTVHAFIAFATIWQLACSTSNVAASCETPPCDALDSGRGLQRVSRLQKLKQRIDELEEEIEIIEGDLRDKCEECSCLVADYELCLEENEQVTQVSIRQKNIKKGNLRLTRSNRCKDQETKAAACVADLKEQSSCRLEYRIPNYMYTMETSLQVVNKVVKYCERCTNLDS